MNNDKQSKNEAQEYAAEVLRVIDANPNLTERAKASLHVVWDDEENALFLTFGEDYGAASISIGNDFVIRYDPESLQIIGLELYFFREHLSERSAPCRVCLDLVELSGSAIQVVPAGTDKTIDVGREIRELLPA